MGRAIGAVIAGYIAMAAVIFVAFTAAYAAMGADGAFRPGTYEVSTLWLVVSLAVSFGAAVVGGLVCAAIARTATPPKVLAAVVVVLGLASALPTLTRGDAEPKARSGGVSNSEAMRNAEQPVAVALALPFIGALGVLAGAALRRRPQ